MEYIIILTVMLFSITKVITGDNLKKPIFNAMTPYFWVKSINETIPENRDGSFMYGGHSCQITNFHYLFRHAARYPSLPWIQKMDNISTVLRGDSLVVTKHPFIGNWRTPFPKSKQYQQSVVGDEEMLQLGERFVKRFRNNVRKNAGKIMFETTSKDRTKQSKSKFCLGLENVMGKQSITTSTDDRLLRYYDYCGKYIKEVDQNNETLTEFYKFLNGDEMKSVVNKVRQKIGTSEIEPAEIVTIQQICAFELGMFEKSNWCQFFDMEDLLIIDYLIDIRNYWEMGYGYNINWQTSCAYTSRLFKMFRNVVNGKRHNEIYPEPFVIQFGHTDTIIPLYTAFGLFNNSQKLLADNYLMNKNRTFRTSLIGPFSANLGFGLYKCDTTMAYVIRLFVNEEPVVIPACGQTSCLFSEFETYYHHLANCNVKQICEINTNMTGNSFIMSSDLLLVLLLTYLSCVMILG
ncbi:multiple inositol polyphosphate phosphatase 1-like isoform X1 [Mytilus edulis]|uniref:multiple inositol polyphosphate phosphatase 1-like isoform X1 n=2 Tax=Mytilus edulis TaxID=6550 RepID=UPI0039EFF489